MDSIHEKAFSRNFEMQDFIAQGTFAKVFKCVERTTGQVFAVKAFQTQDDNFDQEQIDNEVDIWRTLQHHNIVSLYKRFYEHSTVWIVLELVNGKTLFDEIVNQIEYTEEESKRIVQQVRGNFISDYFPVDHSFVVITTALKVSIMKPYTLCRCK